MFSPRPGDRNSPKINRQAAASAAAIRPSATGTWGHLSPNVWEFPWNDAPQPRGTDENERINFTLDFSEMCRPAIIARKGQMARVRSVEGKVDGIILRGNQNFKSSEWYLFILQQSLQQSCDFYFFQPTDSDFRFFFSIATSPECMLTLCTMPPLVLTWCFGLVPRVAWGSFFLFSFFFLRFNFPGSVPAPTHTVFMYYM